MVKEQPSKAVTVSEQMVLANWKDTQEIAKAFVASGMFSDVKSQAQAIVKIVAGAELGLPPVYSMQNINLIRNRLTTSANTMAMLVKKSGNYNYRIMEHTDKVCTIDFFEREGDKWVKVGVSSFSIEDAKRAELMKPDSGWMKFPRAMLFSRAISQGARIYCPDAIGGVYTDEEIRSIPTRPEDATIAKVDTDTGQVVEGESKEVGAEEQSAGEGIPEIEEKAEVKTEVDKLAKAVKDKLEKDETPVTPEQLKHITELMANADMSYADLGSFMNKDKKWGIKNTKELKNWQFEVIVKAFDKGGLKI